MLEFQETRTTELLTAVTGEAEIREIIQETRTTELLTTVTGEAEIREIIQTIQETTSGTIRIIRATIKTEEMTAHMGKRSVTTRMTGLIPATIDRFESITKTVIKTIDQQVAIINRTREAINRIIIKITNESIREDTADATTRMRSSFRVSSKQFYIVENP